MPLVDHLIVLVLIIGVPLYEQFRGIDRMRCEMAENKPGIRLRWYWKTIGIQWAVTALVVGWWFGNARPAAAIGFASPAGWGFWLGLALALIGAAALAVIQRLQTRTDARRAEALRQIEKIAPFMPRDAGELRHFVMLSLTAGVCEEVVYRGYLIWYALAFTGDTHTGIAAAVILPALFFGLAHLYQGQRGMTQVFIAGVVFGLVYVLTGSLWVPILLHAAADIIGGLLAVHLYRHAPPGDKAGAATPAPIAAS